MFGGMIRLGSFKSQPKLQAPEKFQAPNLNAPPWMATASLGPWFGALDLELLWSLVFGAWCLGSAADTWFEVLSPATH